MGRLAWNYYRLPNLSSLVGPLIGAIAGLAGGAFAALASIRASQIAARAPLANTLFELAKAHVALGVSMVDKGDVSECRRYFLTIWNQLATQQAILCPSNRIGALLVLMNQISQSEDARHMLLVSGLLQSRIAMMIAAQRQIPASETSKLSLRHAHGFAHAFRYSAITASSIMRRACLVIGQAAS